MRGEEGERGETVLLRRDPKKEDWKKEGGKTNEGGKTKEEGVKKEEGERSQGERTETDAAKKEARKEEKKGMKKEEKKEAKKEEKKEERGKRVRQAMALDRENMIARVEPRRGRLLVFPHICPHEGRPTCSNKVRGK